MFLLAFHVLPVLVLVKTCDEILKSMKMLIVKTTVLNAAILPAAQPVSTIVAAGLWWTACRFK